MTDSNHDRGPEHGIAPASTDAAELSHGHSHGHGEMAVASAQVRQILLGAVAVIGVLALIGLALLWPRGEALVSADALGFGRLVDATVDEVRLAPCSYDPVTECVEVIAELTSGSSVGSTVALETDVDAELPLANLDPGDRIVLSDAGPGVPPQARYSFADMQRRTPLLVLSLIFAVAVVALGRWRGLLALAGLGVTFAVLVAFVLPALQRGTSPIGVALTGAVTIAFAALYLAHGLNLRTTVALLGTVASLAITAALGFAFANAARLTGLATEEATNLLVFAPELDFRGLLLAAVIIGALGVLDDVTVTQVSAVNELSRARPDLGRRDLYLAGIRIGRDHIASTVNTLVLAYAAAALPLLLIFTQSGLGFVSVITSETVAVEVVQTLVGSIGLVVSVPITTGLAVWVIRHR